MLDPETNLAQLPVGPLVRLCVNRDEGLRVSPGVHLGIGRFWGAIAVLPQ